MRIDRERFLLLAAALATGAAVTPGCTGSQTPPPEKPRSSGDNARYATAEPAPQVGQPASPPVIATMATTSSVTPEPNVTDPLVSVALATSDAGAPSPDPYKGTPVTAQPCNPALNSTGSPPSCALKAPGPTCESFNDTKQECPTLKQLLKPRVAAAAIECLQRKSGTEGICEFNITSICAYEALGSACLDPSAKAACNGVMARCGSGPRGNYNKMTRESCEAGVSGIADAKRKKFISCITEMCRFETCLTYL